MTFADPQLLWLLALPALIIAASFVGRARTTEQSHPKIPRATLSASGFRFRSSALQRRPLAACAALALLVVALARPQGGEIAVPAVVRARDVLVAVDVSRSMLADDVAPSRLQRARLLVRALADELQGERLGLLPFAGSAFLQSPLSVDYGILRTFLDELGPDMIPAGGSDFTALLTVADEAFGPVDTTADAGTQADRYLIVLSDGEAQDETWRAVAKKLSDRGVRVIALGLGTAAGAMIPDGKGGLVKDERGAVVLSRLEASTLRELARLTDGAYRDASAWIDLPALLRETIARGRASESIEENSVRREELFRWFLAPALVLLAFSLVREFPVTLRPRTIKLGRAALLGLSAGLVFVSPAPTRAAESAAAPDPLVDLVARLATEDHLPAADLARLATLSAERGEADPALPKGALRDALAAVAQGEKSAPKAADWSGLRTRLDALLQPPPPPEQPQQQPKPEDSKPPEEKPEDGQKGENRDASSSSQKDPGAPPPGDPKPSDSQDGNGSPDQNQNSGDPTGDSKNSEASKNSDGGDPRSSDTPQNKPSTAPKGSSDALGELKDSEPKSSSPAQPAPGEDAKEDAPATPEPTQRAGGVSVSGQPREGAVSATDPSLALPQQRLDRVRDADSPAHFFKLIQDSELPPDARERAAAGRTRDW